MSVKSKNVNSEKNSINVKFQIYSCGIFNNYVNKHVKFHVWYIIVYVYVHIFGYTSTNKQLELVMRVHTKMLSSL
jgi:hypothetical protein